MALVPPPVPRAVRRAASLRDVQHLFAALRRLRRHYLGAQERHRRLLWLVQGAYIVLFTAWLLDSHTWPAADVVACFLLIFAIFTMRGVRFLRDWAPFMVLLLAYVALPGVTPGLIGRAHVQFPIDTDRWLFGWFTHGELPTTWLQQQLWQDGRLHWYDYLAAFLYLMHFITPLVVAFVFWMRDRALYWRFVRSYLLLMYAGFATYLIYPMAPPWWASDLHRIPYVVRVLGNVQWAGVSDPIIFLSKYFHVDPVAAMPSMHGAFPVLVWLVLWRVYPRWGWATVLYPIGMAFAVVYPGEHYAIDIIAGWLYAIVAFALVWGGLGRGLRQRLHRPQSLAGRPTLAPAPVPADEFTAGDG
ncbi:MAG TPA: phosphatase PAP2 family protein [Dehalococcoidia bacterium]|nr:phosphatase PAP2 family protein [Dehalococcoidia bacterium]